MDRYPRVRQGLIDSTALLHTDRTGRSFDDILPAAVWSDQSTKLGPQCIWEDREKDTVHDFGITKAPNGGKGFSSCCPVEAANCISGRECGFVEFGQQEGGGMHGCMTDEFGAKETEGQHNHKSPVIHIHILG